MDNRMFNRICEVKRYHALVLVQEMAKYVENKENAFKEVAYVYYDFVHGAIYEENAPQYFIEPVLEDSRFAEVNEFRLLRFRAIKDEVDEVADKIWRMIDDGQL